MTHPTASLRRRWNRIRFSSIYYTLYEHGWFLELTGYVYSIESYERLSPEVKAIFAIAEKEIEVTGGIL